MKITLVDSIKILSEGVENDNESAYLSDNSVFKFNISGRARKHLKLNY